MFDLLKTFDKLESGVWRIATAFQPELTWADARNVTFIDGGVKKTDGWDRFASISVCITPILGFGETISEDRRQLLFGTTTRVFKYDGTSITTIGTGFAGTLSAGVVTAATQWSFQPWGSQMFMTNGINTVSMWPGSGSTQILTAIPFTTAEVLLRFRDYLVAANTDLGINSVHWSDSNAPESWTVASTSSAGQILIRELEEPITAMVPLGENIGIYSVTKLHIMEFIGFPLIFRIRGAIEGIGAVSKHSVISLNRLNYGLSRQGFFMTDGFTFQYIDEPALRTFFLARVDLERISKVTAVHDEVSHQIVWSYPTTNTTDGENDESIAFDYIRNLWSIYSNGWSAMHPKKLFGNVIFGDKTGELFAMHSGLGAGSDTESLTISLLTNTLDLGDPLAIKYIQGLKVGGVFSGGGLSVRVEVSDASDGPFTTSPSFNVPSDFDFIPINIAGRWVRMHFASQSPTNDFNIQWINIYGRSFGHRG